MINFKDRDEVVPSTIIVISLVLLIATLIFTLVYKKPSVADLPKGQNIKTRQLIAAASDAKARAADIQVSSQSKLWQGDPETIMAQILSQLTDRSQRAQLTMSAFRPQKSQIVSGLNELPFSVQISGPYKAILPFIQSFDTPDTKVALRSIQFASLGGDSSTVSATIALSAYCKAPVVAAPVTSIPAKSAMQQTNGGPRG